MALPAAVRFGLLLAKSQTIKTIRRIIRVSTAPYRALTTIAAWSTPKKFSTATFLLGLGAIALTTKAGFDAPLPRYLHDIWLALECGLLAPFCYRVAQYLKLASFTANV